MFAKFFESFSPKTAPALIMVLERFGGGIHKRVDEFLTTLERLAKPLGATNPTIMKRPNFPRPWPTPNNRHQTKGLSQ